LLCKMEQSFNIDHRLAEIGKIKNGHGDTVPLLSERFAAQADAQDELQRFRSQFRCPPVPEGATILSPGSRCIYLCGNSLGLQPVATKQYIDNFLEKWAHEGVEGHFTQPRQWVDIDETVNGSMAKVVGAQPHEVVVMNSLTANLHFLLVSFYRPTRSRSRILIEGKAFPSDIYAMSSQIKFHGFDPKDALVQLGPRKGEDTLRTEDIEAYLEKEGDSVALVLISGIQYYTGQAFQLERVSKAARKKGCVIGVDLAHAVGNIPLALHDWDIDFAVWCTYKYMNAGPGGIGGAFVHSRHTKALEGALPRFEGWWGHRRTTASR